MNVKIQLPAILPKDFTNTPNFGDTELRCHEAERMLELIVRYQKRTTPEKWHPFSFEDYHAKAAHPVDPRERDILDALVGGGEIDEFKSIPSGCLVKDSTGRYHVTLVFLEIIKPFAIVHS